MSEFSSAQILGILAAIGGGLLVGAQRERHKDEHSPNEPAGVRTFTIVALIGAVATPLDTAVQWLAGAAISAFVVTAYLHRVEREPGLTTEMALLATYLLGALAMSTYSLAAALFVTLAVLLQMKQALHNFTRNVLSERELDDALLLAASVLIILPMLPDRTFDPYDVLNPRRIWLFAILIMSINAAGYIGLRAFGRKRGLLLAGFLGGFISSTATIAGMGQRARADAGIRSACVSAALLSNVATIAQLTTVLFAAAPAALQRLWLALLAAGVAAIGIATLFFWRGGVSGEASQPEGRPFNPTHALLFAMIIAAATLLAAVLRGWLGMGGVLLAAASTGLADVHAAAISLAQLSNALDIYVFAYGLAAAFAANSVMKCIAAGAGGRDYALPVIYGVIAICAVLLTAVWMAL